MGSEGWFENHPPWSLYKLQSTQRFLRPVYTSIPTMSSSINDVLDQAAGKAQSSQGESLATFLASLTTSGAILALGLMAYILLRWKCPEY